MKAPWREFLTRRHPGAEAAVQSAYSAETDAGVYAAAIRLINNSQFHDTARAVGAGLFLRGFANVVSVDPGFNPKDAVCFDLSFPKTTYPDAGHIIRFEEEVVRRLSAEPDISSVGASTNIPFGPTRWGARIGVTEQDRSLDIVCGTDNVQGDFFRTIGIPLHRGGN